MDVYRLTCLYDARNRELARIAVARHLYTCFALKSTCERLLFLPLPVSEARGLSPPSLGCLPLTKCSSLLLRQLLQKLEDQLRFLVGLRQHRDSRLFQHLAWVKFAVS